MNDYYLLSAFVGNAFKYDNAFKKLFERYFYNKLKASSLPPHTEFVRADVFSDKSGSDFSVSRVNTAVLSDDERQRLATEVIAAVAEEDSSAQAEAIVVFTVKAGEEYCLTDDKLNLISDRFDALEPLFWTNGAGGASAEQRFRQYCGSGSEFGNIGFTYSSLNLMTAFYESSAYIVVKDGRYGIINCKGEYVVPAGYDRIKPFGIKKQRTYSGDEPKCGFESIYAPAAFYICQISGGYNCDVYDVNGNLIFEGVDSFLPSDETVHHCPRNIYDVDSCETVEVRSIRVGTVHNEPLSRSGDEASGDECEKVEINIEFEVKELQSGIKSTELKYAPVQKAVAELQCRFNYIDEKYYENVLNAPKKLLDILLMMLEALPQVRDIPLNIWLDSGFARVLDTYLLSENKSTDEILTLNIEALEFSVRAFNCLSRFGIKTVGELMKLSGESLADIPHLGPKGLKEVIAMQNIIKRIIDNSLT